MFNAVLMAALATGTQAPDFFFKNRRSCKNETVACTTEVVVKGGEMKGGAVKGGQAAQAPGAKGAQGAQAPGAVKGGEGAKGAQAPGAGHKGHGAQGAQAPAGKGSK